MSECQAVVQKLQFSHYVSHEWMALFDEVTDGLENPSVDDLARAMAATYFRCGMEPDWNVCAMTIPTGMDTLVHEYQRLNGYKPCQEAAA